MMRALKVRKSGLSSKISEGLPGVVNVLFACADDGNRAMLAAALVSHLSQGGVKASWACPRTPRIHPFTLVVLGERGLEKTAPEERPKQPPEVFDVLVLLTDDPRGEVRAAWAARRVLFWPTADLFAGGAESLTAFRWVRDDLEARVWAWLEHESPPT